MKYTVLTEQINKPDGLPTIFILCVGHGFSHAINCEKFVGHGFRHAN